MKYAVEKALEITKDIVVAKMQSSSLSPNKNGGESVAIFFETIYDKVYAIATSDTENE